MVTDIRQGGGWAAEEHPQRAGCVVPPAAPGGCARPSMREYVKVSRQVQAVFEAAIATSAPTGQIVRRAAEFIGAITERLCRPQSV